MVLVKNRLKKRHSACKQVFIKRLNLMLATGELTAIFIETHTGSRRDIEAVRQSIYGDFNHIIEYLKDIGSQAGTLVPHNKDSPSLEIIGVHAFRMSRLFQSYQTIAIFTQSQKYRF